MDEKFKIILFTVVIVLIVGIVVFSVGNNYENTNVRNTNTSASNNISFNQASINSTNSSILNLNSEKISFDELSLHNHKNDCWIVYKGKVYDLTDWLPKHPGSAEVILPYCGNYGFEEAFIKKHGNSKASLFVEVAKLIGDVRVKGNA